ncbi:hypothetical protein [Clostridium sp.]|uniref:hypothetical protein n=1 Tax=Clostridium sp. TaxID=1506 RepID=UPI00321809A4
MRIQKIRIISNNICYGPEPSQKDEVEQHLTISANGRVVLSRYNYGQEPGKYELSSRKKISITEENAYIILNAIGIYFESNSVDVFTTDIGTWDLVITGEDGERTYSGSLCNSLEVNGDDLSDLIRDILGIENLFVFDGNYKPDRIEKININYHRVSKIKPKAPVNETIKYVTWDYSEQLILERKSDTIKHIQRIGTGCVITKEYYVEEGVSGFLDDIDEDSIFETVKGNTQDNVDNPNEKKDYVIMVDFKKKDQLILNGTYDKDGLPEDWPELAQKITSFMQFYGFGEILDPSIYRKVIKRAGKYIFCSVEFNEGGRSYYYLTEDDTISIGDFVLVPVGNDGNITVVEIVNIEYFSEEDAPFPIEKTKYIIKKCTHDDFNVTKFNNAEENESYIHSVSDKKLKRNTWTEIRNQEDIDKLMYDFGGFHDGCLKELRYLSGEYVNKDLSMYPLNSERNIYTIFQRQWKNPSVIEMVFEGVECMTLNPRNEDYDGIIYGAYMVIQDGRFIWFDCDDFKDDYRELYKYNDVTWIKAETVKWRVVDNYLGDEDVFIYRD